MIIKESNLTINVRDLDKSISFYLSIGLTLKTRWGNYYAQLIAPGMVIGLHPTDESNLKKDSGNVSLGFTTENLKQTKKQLIELGILVNERKGEGGEFLHFADPDGTALYFINPKW